MLTLGLSEECDVDTMWCQTESGMKYVDDVVGSGGVPITGSVVRIEYYGELPGDGRRVEMFGKASPASLVIGKMEEPVWEELIAGMQVGGKRRVFIPTNATVNVMWGEGRPEDREVIRFDIQLVEIVEGVEALGAVVQTNFRLLARKLGVSPTRLFILLTFIPYFLPEDIRPGLWKSDNTWLESIFNGQAQGPEAQLDVKLFDESIMKLDNSLYR